MARGNALNARRREEGAIRRARCVELRLAGLTYAQVGQQVGLTAHRAWYHVKAALEQYHEQQMENITVIVAEELQRCDRMLVGLWPKAIRGDVQAVASVLKIMERKARMLGIDKPAKGALTDAEGNDLPETGAIVVTVQEPEDVEAWAAKYRESVTVEEQDETG